MDLLKQVEPHLHLIDLAQRNDVGDPYNKVKIDLKDQKDFVYALNVVERFVKKLLSNRRIQMGRTMAGNGRRIGLFVSTLDTTSGHSSRGLPPGNEMDVTSIFNSAEFYRLCGKKSIACI